MKICENCGVVYDDMLSACPMCGGTSVRNKDRKEEKTVTAEKKPEKIVEQTAAVSSEPPKPEPEQEPDPIPAAAPVMQEKQQVQPKASSDSDKRPRENNVNITVKSPSSKRIVWGSILVVIGILWLLGLGKRSVSGLAITIIMIVIGLILIITNIVSYNRYSNLLKEASKNGKVNIEK